MKKIVNESLAEFLAEDAHGRTGKAKKMAQNPNQKADLAIKALKDQLKKAKDPGQHASTIQKNAKIKELEEKIAKWEAKKKKK